MKFCVKCGVELGDNDNFCASCGSEQGIEPKKTVSYAWVIIAFIIPLASFFAGLYYTIEKRDGGSRLLIFSMVTGIIWGFIYSLALFH